MLDKMSNGVPWNGDDARWDEVRAAWESHANEHVDENGRIDVSEVDTCVGIALTRAFILTAPDLATLAAENERLRDLVIRAEEELRLIRTRDTGAVYDTTLRLDFQLARALTQGETK